jgi:hypothetical protein
MSSLKESDTEGKTDGPVSDDGETSMSPAKEEFTPEE